MNDIIITNAKIVNEGQIKEADVAIKNGRITQIASNLPTEAGRVVDAAGRFLLPGMIDDQVHFREPGLTHKGEIKTESRAAVAGGITTYMEMPNVKPPTLNAQALEDKHALAGQKSLANFSFYLGASNDNLENIKSLDPQAACGVKVFMGASTGNMLVDDPKTLEGIFSSSPVLVAAHCEDTPTINALEAKYRADFGEDVPIKYHPLIRSEEACYKSSSLAVDLAKKFDTRLHVLHITTERELALFSAGDHNKKRITAEACVHHLYFSEEDYEAKGTLIKCNPAVKKKTDRDAILAAVRNNVIDIIATDHAPHTLEEKSSTYFKAPSGLPLVQDALLSLMEHVHHGGLTVEQVVQKVAHAPADCYGVKERGYIREGYWADLVLVNPTGQTEVTGERVLSKCGWSPFEGTTFQASIDMTLVNGEIKYEDGRLTSETPGRRLEFNR